MKPLLFLLFLFALFFAAIVLQAQTTGTLEGCVADSSGVGIPGARIEVVGTSRGAVTRPNGNYLIVGLPAGTYTIRVSSLGMKTVEQRVSISAGVTTTLRITLADDESPGGEVIRVIAERTDLTREDVSGQTTHGAFGVILRDASGSGEDGSLGNRGGRAGEASIRRDGIEISDILTGSEGQALGTFPEVSAYSVENASVTVSGFEAKYGDIINGVVNTGQLATSPLTRTADNAGLPSASLTLDGSILHGVPHSDPVESEQPIVRPVYENPFRACASSPYSTFSIDVDNASYSNVRGYLSRGMLPPAEAVRIEELINYFDYDYPDPTGRHPFAFHSEVVRCPWDTDHLIVRLALQGKRIHPEQAASCNLVFLIDVSGSMSSQDKLPLLKQAFLKLVDKLRPQDRVAIVVYAGAAGLVLQSTPASEKEKIRSAINRLESGGSTAGGAGIQLAYKVARDNYLSDGVNRVILATDGDFNVGVSSDEGLVSLIEEKRKDGVFLSVLGFGTGNYQDAKMEKLADNGNGNYYYIDRIEEGERVLVGEMSGTLHAIAKDVKLQIKFNPSKVAAYRLIGYENRVLAAKDFDDDAKDAGELGAGHTVTALYEVLPVGAQVGFDLDTTKGEDYRLDEERPELLSGHDLLLARLRYKQPKDSASDLIEHIVKDERKSIDKAGESTRFAVAVAEWGMILRGSRYAGSGSHKEILSLAKNALGDDRDGYRKEFLELVEGSLKIAPSP